MTDINSKLAQYSNSSHAGTFRPLVPKADRKSAQIDTDFKQLMREGYIIIEGLLSQMQIADIKRDMTALLDHKGRNSFEGLSTQRIYDVLSKTRVTDRLADHPRILGLFDKLFQPNFLLSQSQVINILPGEVAQTLHYDDGFYKIPRPRQPLGAATIWAIDDFTEENGATVLVPKSHEIGMEAPDIEGTISAVMSAGSVVVFLGTLWHGGGANRSDLPRMAVTHQYCEAYMRQQENYLLELSKDVVRELSPEIRSLVGYSVYPPFMGMVNGKHPLRSLES